jgi:hypothetical protein
VKASIIKHIDKTVDLQIGNSLIEVRRGEDAVRGIRTSIMQLAYSVASRPGCEGFLVLPDSKITRERLREEWKLASSVLKPDLAHRISLYIGEGDHFVGIPRDPDAETQSTLAKVVALEQPRRRSRGAQGNASFVVLKILLHHLVTEGSPVTTGWLERTSGYSYPTIAIILQSLGSLIERQPNRRLRLRWFPKREFSRLLAMAGRARSTVRFADRSGQPRSLDAYVRRLEKLSPPGLAIGGVLGAKHYFPNLDIVGTPRLDVSLHCPDREMDIDFVSQLDPALKRVEDPLEPANLAVHAVRHAESLFKPRKGGLNWADQIECLLDLHEDGLEMQATQFLNHLEVHAKSDELVRKLIDEG